MPKTYDVIVTRAKTESCAMVIEAKNSAAAHMLAHQRAKEDTDLVWEDDDGNLPGSPWVSQCEEIEP